MQFEDIKTFSVFPTVIGSYVDIDIAKKLFPVALEHLANADNLPKPKYPKQDSIFNYKITVDSKIIDNDFFFNKYVINLGNEYLQKIGYKPKDFNCEIFFSEMVKGSKLQSHAHANSILSGIIYLQVPENSSVIRFYDPRPHKKFINLETKTPNDFNFDHISIRPFEGLILIWESWLEHEVLTNESNGRISCSFNLSLSK